MSLGYNIYIDSDFIQFGENYINIIIDFTILLLFILYAPSRGEKRS